MVGELGGVRIEFCRIDRLECFADPTMQTHRPSSGQPVIKHLADELVCETVAARSACHREQDADSKRFLEMIHDI